MRHHSSATRRRAAASTHASQQRAETRDREPAAGVSPQRCRRVAPRSIGCACRRRASVLRVGRSVWLAGMCIPGSVSQRSHEIQTLPDADGSAAGSSGAAEPSSTDTLADTAGATRSADPAEESCTRSSSMAYSTTRASVQLFSAAIRRSCSRCPIVTCAATATRRGFRGFGMCMPRRIAPGRLAKQPRGRAAPPRRWQQPRGPASPDNVPKEPLHAAARRRPGGQWLPGELTPGQRQ